MRAIVCGGRKYTDKDTAWPKLDSLGITEVIQGEAPGADRLAKDWARSRGIPCQSFPAAWSDLSHPDAVIRTRPDGTKYDAKAGSRRNQQMIDEGKPEAVVALPGGTGTADMVRRGKAAGLRIYRMEGE